MASQTNAVTPELIRLDGLEEEMHATRDNVWAWDNFHATVVHLAKRLRATRILEIGGGRSPMFSGEEITELGVDYVVNDRVQRELDKAPPFGSKARFDIAGAATELPNDLLCTVDLVFSKMVFEHVSDAISAYTNIHALLRPNGVGLNFHPVLYSPPFIINRILPEHLSNRLVNLIQNNLRSDDGVPKFPARYDYCVIRPAVRSRIGSIGFSEVCQIPFFGHSYLNNIPVIRELERSLHTLAAKMDLQLLASFAYTIVRK